MQSERRAEKCSAFREQCAIRLPTPFPDRLSPNAVIQTFYERLRKAGKPPKVALLARMRKLLTTLTAMV